MDLGQLFAIVIGATFVSNYVLMRYLGLCPFVGVSKDIDSAIGMGMAVIFVMTLASLATWLVYMYVLVPLGIEEDLEVGRGRLRADGVEVHLDELAVASALRVLAAPDLGRVPAFEFLQVFLVPSQLLIGSLSVANIPKRPDTGSNAAVLDQGA